MSAIDDSIKMKYQLQEDDSYVMSATVENETTACSLRAVNYVSKALNMRVDVETTSLQKGSVERLFKFIVKGKADNELQLAIFMFVLQSVFYHNRLLKVEDILSAIEEKQKVQAREILKRHQIDDNALVSIYNNNSLRKNRNGFYKSLENYKRVKSISIFNGRNFDYTKEAALTVQSKDFKNYISDARPEIVVKDDAIVFLEAPVVVDDDNLKWIGVYNNHRRRFKMESTEFKVKTQNGDVPFKNGTYVKCKVEYKEDRTDNDEPLLSDFVIKEVYGVGVEENYQLTLAGKKRKVEKESPQLFTDEDFK